MFSPRSRAMRASKSQSRGKHGRKSQAKSSFAYTRCIITTILYNLFVALLRKCVQNSSFLKKATSILPKWDFTAEKMSWFEKKSIKSKTSKITIKRNFLEYFIFYPFCFFPHVKMSWKKKRLLPACSDGGDDDKRADESGNWAAVERFFRSGRSKQRGRGEGMKYFC